MIQIPHISMGYKTLKHDVWHYTICLEKIFLFIFMKKPMFETGIPRN